jgi:hypothetical protein
MFANLKLNELEMKLVISLAIKSILTLLLLLDYTVKLIFIRFSIEILIRFISMNIKLKG